MESMWTRGGTDKTSTFLKKIVFEHTLVTLYYLYKYYILDTAQLQVLQLCYKVKKNCQVLKSRKSYYKVRRCFADIYVKSVV